VNGEDREFEPKMKLKKTKSRTYEGKDYFRWTIQIPPTEVEILGWQAGEELVCRAFRGTLQIRRRAR
jgi:hypothetical protein